MAVKPVTTQAWLPCDTVIATGRFVLRRFVTADRRAESKLPLAGELISAVDVSSKPGRPARRIDPVRHGDRVPVVGAHVVEIALLGRLEWSVARSAMLRMIWTSAAVHHSHVFWVVNTPDR